MDQSTIRFDKSPDNLLEDIKQLSNNFIVFDNNNTNNTNINTAFKIVQSSNKLLYNYTGVMCKKVWDYLNKNKRVKFMQEDNYISFSKNPSKLSEEEFEKWDKVLLITDEINGFIDLNINFNENITLEFLNDFVNYLQSLSKTIDILLFYYVHTTRSVTFTTIDDLTNLISSAKNELEDDIIVKCNNNFSLEDKFNIINYYYELFILNSKTDIIIHNIWGTEEEYNNREQETKEPTDKFDIFSKLFNNNTLGKCDSNDMEENDMGNILKNAMMNMFGGLGGLGGLNKNDDDDDLDDDVDEENKNEDEKDDDVDNDPDVQAIEKLISNISDKGHFSADNDDNLD